MTQMDVSGFLRKLLSKEDLSRLEAESLLELMIGEDISDGQIAALLTALAAKGETEDELAGFASVMRSRSTGLSLKSATGFVDTCGTGGSTIKTFNVSTAAAFIVSAAGVPVAKHGNVAVTSRAGSADVLRALGVKLELPVARIEDIFHEIGVCFMFAPGHHAATRRVAQIRRELGVRTIFNWIGPLTNPAGAPFQVIGVSDATGWKRVAGALARLGSARAWVVRGNDGLDEITLSERTRILEVKGHDLTELEVQPEEFGYARAGLEELRGGSPDENAALITKVLGADLDGPARDLVAMNAAASLLVAGRAATPLKASEMAEEVIKSGAALAKLRKFCELTKE